MIPMRPCKQRASCSTPLATLAMLTFLELSLIFMAACNEKPTRTSEPAVLIGAGDIADCSNLANAEDTADLVVSIPGTVFADGDLAYPDGSNGVFASCYDPTWGQFKGRTRPVLGNHEYQTPNAQGYFSYWGSSLTGTGADPTKGYYSYDLGPWHIVVINSNCDKIPGGCLYNSPQQRWLQSDLAANAGVCTLALWHAPLFVGQGSTDQPELDSIWQTLYQHDVHVIVNGHVHDYERWARQDPDGIPTGAGIRQFVVGTGGSPTLTPTGYSAPNLQVLGIDYGVLMFTLRKDSYDWQHVIVGGSPGDSGSESCHSIP